MADNKPWEQVLDILDGKNSTIYKRFDKLRSKMKGSMCSTVLGAGQTGMVFIPSEYPRNFTGVMSGKQVQFPIVIKTFVDKGGGNTDVDDYDDEESDDDAESDDDFSGTNSRKKDPKDIDDYIDPDVFVTKSGKNYILFGDDSLAYEVLILSIMSEMRDTNSIHVPHLVDFAACKHRVDSVVTPLYGLRKPVSYKVYRTLPYRTFERNGIEDYRKKGTTLATLNHFFDFLKRNVDKNNKVTIPEQDMKLDVRDVIETFLIQFLHTQMMLYDLYKCKMNDMHDENLYVEFLHDTPFNGKTIDNMKYLVYQLGKNNFIRIPNIGAILKIGDVGKFELLYKDDLALTFYDYSTFFDKGRNKNRRKYNHESFYENFPYYGTFLYILQANFPNYGTILDDIISNLPFNRMHDEGFKISYDVIKMFPTSENLLKSEHFDRYRINNEEYNKNKNSSVLMAY